MKLHLPLSLRCRLLATFLLAAASIYANFSTTLFSGSIPEDYTEVILKDAKSLTESAAEASGANVAYRLVYQDGGITVESPAQALMPSAAGSRYFTAEQAETPASLRISKAETTLFTLDSNESLSWQALGTLSYTENTSSASGGLVYASSSADLSWIGNEKVEFVGNHATNGGAIYGFWNSTITLSNNGTVSFSGNTASYSGGAIYGYSGSSITLSDNGTVSFSGNTAEDYGGAIYSRGNLHIRNNDSVEFAGNVEKSGSTYRLRSIYVYGGSGDVVSLSAAEGKSITFRDAMLIGVGTTVDFNADYNGLKQKGDILFTGATTEADLLAAKGRAGTAEEILNSRTTEVLAMTNLYGGRLRVEDGAVYRGYGMTAHAGADATILIKDATLEHVGYNIVMGSGSSLVLEGDNLIAGNVMLQEGSTLVLDSSSALGVNDISGSLQWSEGAQFLWHPGEDSHGANTVLLYVSEGISGWDSVQVSTGSSSYSSGDFIWVDGFLLLNYEAESFNRYVNGSASFSSTQRGSKWYHHYQELAFLDVTGGAIFGWTGSSITLSDNGTVSFSGNTASGRGGAIYGGEYNTITLSDNDTVSFSGNTARYYGGGAIYGGSSSTITLSNNGEVSFSGNTASDSDDAHGGAIYGYDSSTITLSNNGTVSFSGNTASDSDDAHGGAIYGYYSSTITLSNNDTVSFSGNTASGSSNGSGGAIYGDTITLSNNGEVTFSGNRASGSSYGYGGAICGYDYSTITLSNNGTVSFSENTASGTSYGYGGAIYGDGYSRITLSNNGTVSFSENTASGTSYGYGGAIYGYSNSTITLSNNDTVSFSGNRSSGEGGAIYGYSGSSITLSDNGTVSFSGNTASGRGGAIYGFSDSTITLSNNGTVTFSGNTAGSYGGAIDGSTITLSNNGEVTFSGNTAGSYGGAIYGDGCRITLSNNDTVSFSGNRSSGEGGAICGYDYSTITLSDNGTVTFSGNSGGAIYSDGKLHIRNNDSVEFAGNVEKSDSTYRLRSIYAYGGSGDVVFLSAAEGKSIIFRDAMYIGSGTTVNFNADYNGLAQKGDILFTGATTEADLLAVKGRAGTAEEILNSRTTEVLAMTNLYGGRLRVEDGAVYKGYGITVQEGSEATVRVKDATLNHKGYTLSFASGTILELEGANSLSGDLLMKSGSSLSFVLQEATAVAGRHSGALTVQEGVELRLQLDCEDWQGAEKTLLLIASDAGSAASCAESSLRTVGVSNALWGYKDAYWQEGNLFVDVRKTDTVTWDNAAGDYRWNHLSANWTDEGYRYSYVQGAHVVLGQSGAGTIRVLGDMAIAGMSVEGGSSYCLEWAEDSSLAVADYLRVDSRSSLDFGGDLSLVSVENQGHLTVAGDLTALSAVSGMGQLNVAGTLTAASLQAAGLTADTLTLTEVGAQSRIGSDVALSGATTVAGGLQIEGALSAASLQTEALAAESLTLTEAGVQNRIGSDVALSGAATVAGGLQIEGAFSAASLQTEVLAAESLTLTEVGAQSRIGSNVSFAGDATVAGALAVEGSLSAQKVSIGGELSAATVQTSDLVAGSVQVQTLTADTLTLTEAGAQSRIGSDVSFAGDATVAGALAVEGSLSAQKVSIGGELSAATVQTSDLLAGSVQVQALTADTLMLKESGAQNRIGSDVSFAGDATVAGALAVEGSLSAQKVSIGGELSATTVQTSDLVAGSVQVQALMADTLTLTEAGAQSRIGSNVSFAGDATVAGALAVEGSLSAQKVSIGGELSAATVQTSDLVAGSVQVQALTADTLTLTESGTQSHIGSDVSFAGDATVAGALAVEGSLSAQKVSIGGELSAATVQTSDLLAGSVQVQAVTADTLTLTESGAQSRIGSDVALSGAATVAGGLQIEGALSAASLQTEALAAESLTLTEAGVQNRIGSSVTLSGAATVAGSLQIEGAFSAASLQAEALTAESLTLTASGAQNRIGSSVALSGAATVAGGLQIDGAFSAASLQAGSLSAESLTLTDAAARNKVEGLLELRGTEVTHRVSGDLAAEMVRLAAGATLETDGVLTSSTVQMSGKVGGLTAAAFGAAEMDFVLDRKALEGLNLSHMQTATIARTGEAFAEDFSVLLNGSATESTDAAAYTYTIAGAGNEVQVTADYRWWDTRVWYRGGWVGEAEWTDHLIAGYDAVDGVETIDLGGESFAGYTLMVELEEGVSAVQVSNGTLSFEYIDMFAGQLNIGPGTEVQVAELWGEGLTLSLSGEVTKLTVSEYLTVGTLAMDYATLTVKDAEVAELTGDAGSLVISEGGVVTVDSDVTLSGMRNGGSLDIGSHKLVVNGLTSAGGDVTAGEVETRSNMRTAAQFNKLVADKVTVRNSNSSTRYTDDLSVGAGSAIGELVAETLTVREGTVMLGHDERATAQELQKLTLNAATAELVLNEATSLAVTNSLSAKSGAKVQMKKDATLVYKELGIGNRQGAGMVTVDAYGLSRGATLSLEKAHVTLRSSETTELDHLLAESSVENLGSGTLKLTHADNRLTGIAATGGDVEVYNSAVSHDLQELYIASQMTVSVLLSAPEEAFDAAQEATLNVLGTASFGSEATLKANLTLQAGATLEMQGPVHMGSTVTLTAGSLLGDALLNRVQTMLPGDSTTLFTGVDKLVLFDGTTGYTYLPGDLTAADDVPASRYFTNLMGDDYVLTFRGDGSEGDLAIEMVPEPATATLSLLALAALASRRRRK